MNISTKTFQFLIENRLRNDKNWFHENKGTYIEYVFNPLAELVVKLTPTLLKIDEQLIVEPKTDKTISRVYRDTRFSKDKLLYRDLMWISFCRNKKEYDFPPGLVLEITPKGFRYGCGYYSPEAKTMNAYRELILSNDKAFLEADKAYRSQDKFQLIGEMMKNSKFSNESEQKKDWLNRKNIDIMYESDDFDLLYSDNFYKDLSADFLSLKPFYDFCLKTMFCAMKM